MNQTKVTIITACYNGEVYLKDCFFYVLNQSYDNVEYIIIDDGSTDNSLTIMESYISKFRERGYEYLILKKKNGGAASAINIALKKVTGEYLMVYDVDDILMKEAVKEKALFLDNHPEYGIIRNNGYYVKSKNLEQNSYLFVTKKKEKENKQIFEDILFGRTNNWSGSFMIRCSSLFHTIKNKSLYVSPWGQNLQLLLPVAYNYHAGFIDKPLMRYVDHGKSVSRDTSLERQLQLLNGYMENRIEIIKSIKMEPSITINYINEVQQFYSHIKLKLAMENNMTDLLVLQYKKLEECYDIRFIDKYYYFLGHCPILRKSHLVICKLLKAVWCIFHKIEGKLLRDDKLC